MMKYFVCIVSFLFIQNIYAQFDNQTTTNRSINATESNRSLNQSLNINSNRGLSNNQGFLNSRPRLVEPEKKEETFSMSTDHGLLTRKFDYKPSWLTQDEEIKPEYAKGMRIGRFGTESKTIEVLCRDHQYVDGDRVRIILNDKVVVHNVVLRADFQSFILELEPGQNVIEFEALNQGTSGPNTAQFRVYDDQNNLLTENVWNLLTGARATMLVIRN